MRCNVVRQARDPSCSHGPPRTFSRLCCGANFVCSLRFAVTLQTCEQQRWPYTRLLILAGLSLTHSITKDNRF